MSGRNIRELVAQSVGIIFISGNPSVSTVGGILGRTRCASGRCANRAALRRVLYQMRPPVTWERARPGWRACMIADFANDDRFLDA